MVCNKIQLKLKLIPIKQVICNIKKLLILIKEEEIIPLLICHSNKNYQY